MFKQQRPIKKRPIASRKFRSATLVSALLVGLMVLQLALPMKAQHRATSTDELKQQLALLNLQGPQRAGSTNIPVDSSCYPDAPPELKLEAIAAAQLIVRTNDPSEISSFFFQLLFFTTIDAISRDANLTLVHDDLVDRLEIKRLQAQIKRTDKQIGASARADGSTSAAEKPGFVDLLGFAVEHGAIQQEVNGTTLTLSTSPYALVAAAQGDTATTYQNYGYLSRVGLSASFNITNQNNVLANATSNQLAEWNVRAQLTPDRTMRSQDAENIWNGISQNFAQPSLVITRELATQFQADQQLNAKRREIEAKLLSVFTAPAKDVLNNASLSDQQKIQDIAKLILCRVKADIFDQIRSGALRIDQSTRDRMINATIPAFAVALRAKEAAIKIFEDQLTALSFKPVLTLAYTNKREAMSSDYSVLKLLFEKKASEGFSFIANAGLSFYHNPNRQMNQQQVRDYAAAFSLEGNAGRSPFLSEDLDESKITFALTGRYQRLLENRGVADKKADLAVAQFKLEIPLYAGITIPLSVTYANATELIKEDHVRANFGFTVDTDKIFQILSLKKKK